MIKAKCPHCSALLEHFDQIGEETGWRCPECKGEVDPSTIEKVEVEETAGSDTVHPQETK